MNQGLQWNEPCSCLGQLLPYRLWKHSWVPGGSSCSLRCNPLAPQDWTPLMQHAHA